MCDEPVINALVEQVECYRQLARLAGQQHTHVQQGQTEQLLDVLRRRQEVLDLASTHRDDHFPGEAALAGIHRRTERRLAGKGRRRCSPRPVGCWSTSPSPTAMMRWSCSSGS